MLKSLRCVAQGYHLGPKAQINQNFWVAAPIMICNHNPIMGLIVESWAKLTSFATFGPILPRRTVLKTLLDTFSGSTNLWWLLGDSGPSNITCW